MSTKIVPESRTMVCDCCQRDIGSGGVHRAQSGGLHVRRDALDMQGSAFANADVKLDLCDSCLTTVISAINDTCARVREQLAAQSGAVA